jgi:hypothetical protein
MFDSFKRKKAEVLSHWYSLVPNFTASTKEFYEAVEKQLSARKVPGLEISRVEFSEGGMLSGKREYLRMTRERLVFDICAAPFGTSYFFSCRFAEIPVEIKFWHVLVLFAGWYICLVVSLNLCIQVFGIYSLVAWPLGWITAIALAIYTLRNAVAMGLRDLDTALIKIPVVGPVYERFLRKETYYREDTRLMYLDTVNSVVKALVEETTGAQGIKLIRFNEYNPILEKLYRPTTVTLPRTAQPA